MDVNPKIYVLRSSYINCSIKSLEYPDAYSCRRCTRICHRILETVAWVERYTDLIGSRLLTAAVKNIVTEPKWMIGIEWDMINVIRDIYGRLTLGQYFLPGGQGPGLQQIRDPNNTSLFEQTKVVDKPLLGGGILTKPSDFPRHIFIQIGVGQTDLLAVESALNEKRSAKEQVRTMQGSSFLTSDSTAQQNSAHIEGYFAGHS